MHRQARRADADEAETKDLKVRQADRRRDRPEGRQRPCLRRQGAGESELFQSSFPWDPKVPGPSYDPETAKKLVTEAKAAGWNGTVRLLFVNTQVSRDIGLAVQTMLQTVGINAHDGDQQRRPRSNRS